MALVQPLLLTRRAWQKAAQLLRTYSRAHILWGEFQGCFCAEEALGTSYISAKLSAPFTHLFRSTQSV